MDTNEQIAELTSQVEEYYNQKPWYGNSLLKILEDVSETDAFRQPSKDAHSIAELVSHLIYWRMALIKRLEGNLEYKPSMKSEENWQPLEKLTAEGWAALKGRLNDSQDALVSLLKEEDDTLLEKVYSEKATFRKLIVGVIQHDIYHTGQVAYVKSLLAKK